MELTKTSVRVMRVITDLGRASGFGGRATCLSRLTSNRIARSTSRAWRGKGKPASCSCRLLQITDRRPPISNSRLRPPAQLQQFLLAEVPPIARIRPHAAKAGLGFENQ